MQPYTIFNVNYESLLHTKKNAVIDCCCGEAVKANQKSLPGKVLTFVHQVVMHAPGVSFCHMHSSIL